MLYPCCPDTESILLFLHRAAGVLDTPQEVVTQASTDSPPFKDWYSGTLAKVPKPKKKGKESEPEAGDSSADSPVSSSADSPVSSSASSRSAAATAESAATASQKASMSTCAAGGQGNGKQALPSVQQVLTRSWLQRHGGFALRGWLA